MSCVGHLTKLCKRVSFDFYAVESEGDIYLNECFQNSYSTASYTRSTPYNQRFRSILVDQNFFINIKDL